MMTKVYHASLYDRTGYLARIDRALTFLDMRTNETTELEPEMLPHVSGGVHRVPDLFVPAIVARMRGCHEHLNCSMGS